MTNAQSPRPCLAVVWFMENEVSCQIRSRNVPPLYLALKPIKKRLPPLYLSLKPIHGYPSPSPGCVVNRLFWLAVSLSCIPTLSFVLKQNFRFSDVNMVLKAILIKEYTFVPPYISIRLDDLRCCTFTFHRQPSQHGHQLYVEAGGDQEPGMCWCVIISRLSPPELSQGWMLCHEERNIKKMKMIMSRKFTSTEIVTLCSFFQQFYAQNAYFYFILFR